MFVITAKNSDMIIYITETAERIEDQLILVDHGTLNISSAEKLPIIEVASVPAEVEAQKYCYSETKGFYANPDYVEPVPEPTMQDLQTQIAELSANLDYMSMVASVDLPDSEEE